MYRVISQPTGLPYALYKAEQARSLDQYIIEKYGIPSLVLMQRAGTAAWQAAQKQWPHLKDITVICGLGNNGGDGYVFAYLALAAGCQVRVLQVGDPSKLTPDTLNMSNQYQLFGGKIYNFHELPARTDLIVDAVFGTGLSREITDGNWVKIIEDINEHPAPKLAIDIPSGLNADSGRIMGCAVRANLTVTFITLKRGLFTGHGPEHSGTIVFANLQVPAGIYAKEILTAKRINWQLQSKRLKPRSRSAHKGHFGHVLIIGGAPGMGGALKLAGMAAARCGAGLVSLATYPGQAAIIGTDYPELMCHEIANPTLLEPLLQRATVVVIGPGLGQTSWAKQMLEKVLTVPQPLIVDADAINLLATKEVSGIARTNWILTPHPGEAARMLACSPEQIQFDRFAAIDAICRRYGGTIVLKGAGTLIQDQSGQPPAVCGDGNPGMASGGMGDLLTGTIAAFIAQGWDLDIAARMGTCLHGAAADLAAKNGERGLLASDLLPHLRTLINPVLP
ncbi:carbohydrate kinase [Achromatium sp. WMS2]|nr:carbohydrate kinase [Achromatium sp. WMS2]